MLRFIMLAPKVLTEKKREALEKIFSDINFNVPETKSSSNKIIVDALAPDDFDEAKLAKIRKVKVIGKYRWNGGTELEVLTPLNKRSLKARRLNLDATMTEFHNWAGWPEIK